MSPLLQLLIAILIGFVIWRVSTAIIRTLATPPPEANPEDVVETEQHYRCEVCGTELVVHTASRTETDAPKHCREEMTPIWRP